jgi:hypothetical protein
MPETDPEFLRRLLAELDAQAGDGGPVPHDRVAIASADLMRLIRLCAGVPSTAFRIN